MSVVKHDIDYITIFPPLMQIQMMCVYKIWYMCIPDIKVDFLISDTDPTWNQTVKLIVLKVSSSI